MGRAPNGSFTHGASGYTNYDCRCDICRKGNTERHKLWTWIAGRNRPREQYLAERYPEPPPHGTVTRYGKKWRCRCDECRTAATAARREHRQRTAAA